MAPGGDPDNSQSDNGGENPLLARFMRHSMKRPWLAGVGSVLVLGTLSFGAWLLTRPASSATEANFERIQKGMTKAQVESILGKPDIFEMSHKTTSETGYFEFVWLAVSDRGFGQKVTATSAIAIWIGGDTHFVVSLSDNYIVNNTGTFTWPQPTLAERIRSWLR
jgi:SmpA / OmlA family